MASFFLNLPPKWFLKDLKQVERALARISSWSNNVNLGKINVVGGPISLTASATTTTLNDIRIGAASVILFMPITTEGAAQMDNIFITNRGNGTCTINHASVASAVQSFDYVVFG